MTPVLYGTLNFIQASAPTASTEDAFVFGRLSSITRFLYENFSSIDAAGKVDYTVPGYITFVLVFVLSALVYKLGFAKKLSFKQNVVIYIFLFVGCVVLTFLALFLPMIEGLIVAALILILYKTRLWREKREEHKAQQQ